jgi:hypothetical protein
MTDEMPTAVASRWLMGLLVTTLFSMFGILWNNISVQIADLKTDNRVLQKDVADLHVSVRDLNTRITLLVTTLNNREERQLRK